MSRTPKPTCSWDPLQKRLGGSFTAGARGLLAPVLELFCPDGEGLGRLSLGAAPGTRLWFTDQTAALEVSGRRLHLVSDGKELLAASPKRRSLDGLEISCNGRAYIARASSSVTARSPAERQRGGGARGRGLYEWELRGAI